MPDKDDREKQDVRAGKGRRDEVGRSGVYPMSGPHPKGPAEIRTEASWGQGERGAAGYEDHGTSELTYEEGQLLGGSEDESAEVPEGEVPRAQWVRYFDLLSKRLRGSRVRIEVGSDHRVEQHDVMLDGIGADLKDRENSVSITAGSDSVGRVTHLIPAVRSVKMYRADGVHVLEIESARGPLTTVRIGPVDAREAA